MAARRAGARSLRSLLRWRPLGRCACSGCVERLRVTLSGRRPAWVRCDPAIPTTRYAVRSDMVNQPRSIANPKGEAQRFTSRAADKVRAGRQPQNGEGARPHCAAFTDRPRRRADRVNRTSAQRSLLHLLTSAVGTHRRSALPWQQSQGIGGEPDAPERHLGGRGDSRF
jgi:hypothetical protein